MREILSERWHELAEIKAALAARDWFPGTSGNLSIKVGDDPLLFFVTASGKDKTKQTDEDFLLVDGECRVVGETELKPSAETVIHRDIYRKTGAGCILHVHTIENNVISEMYGDAGEVRFRGQEIIKAFGLWEPDVELTVPIVENLADLPALAEQTTARIHEDVYGVLIRNHGITAWGCDGFEAKKHLEAFEFLFGWHLALKRHGLA